MNYMKIVNIHMHILWKVCYCYGLSWVWIVRSVERGLFGELGSKHAKATLGDTQGLRQSQEGDQGDGGNKMKPEDFKMTFISIRPDGIHYARFRNEGMELAGSRIEPVVEIELQIQQKDATIQEIKRLAHKKLEAYLQ